MCLPMAQEPLVVTTITVNALKTRLGHRVGSLGLDSCKMAIFLLDLKYSTRSSPLVFSEIPGSFDEVLANDVAHTLQAVTLGSSVNERYLNDHGQGDHRHRGVKENSIRAAPRSSDNSGYSQVRAAPRRRVLTERGGLLLLRHVIYQSRSRHERVFVRAAAEKRRAIGVSMGCFWERTLRAFRFRVKGIREDIHLLKGRS